MNANAFDDMDPRGIESWALDRDFDRLTDEERTLVMKHLGSRAAYDRLRLSVGTLRRTLAEEQRALRPDPALGSSLHAALSRRHPQKRAAGGRAAGGIGAWLRHMLSRPVPLYQPVLGAAVVLLAIVLIPRGSDVTPGPRPAAPAIVERAHVPVRDTVVIRTIDDAALRRITDSVREEVRGMIAEERRNRTVERVTEAAPRERDTRRESPEIESPSGTDAPAEGNRFVGLANLSQLDVQRRGKSLTEDSAYRQFSVTIP